MKVSLNWLKDYVDVRVPLAEFAHRLTMAGLEAKLSESGMDVEITSNRPDWLSHIGVAREASAVFGKKLKIPSTQISKKIPKSSRMFRIAIEDLKLCPYYSAVLLEGIQPVETPEGMEKRLEAVGLRSIHFLVDVTNYVLLEAGQPLHAFDADLIEGDTIYIRPARKGEKLLAIDGREYELISSDLVIADKGGPIAIAGVMGGKRTEVNPKTRNMLLESAFFNPVSVRSTSRRLGLASESSYRFERRVDPQGVNWGRDRAVQLVAEHASVSKISNVFRGGKIPVRARKIPFAIDFLAKSLGFPLSQSDAGKILKNLGLKVVSKKNSFLVDVPSFRPDLALPIDLVEEVARIYGYDRIPETLPPSRPIPKIEESIFLFLDDVRRFATGSGFQEVCNFSLIHEENLLKTGWKPETLTRIINPQHKELSVMRPTLMQGLVENVKRNLHLGNPDLAIFEVGRAYGPEGAKHLPDEVWHLGLALAGRKNLNWMDKGRSATLYDLKGFLGELREHFSVSDLRFVESRHPFLADQATLEIRVGHEPVGVLGELREDLSEAYDLDQKIYLAEVNLQILAKRRTIAKQFIPIPKFPRVERDLALLVPCELKAETLLERVRATAGELLKDITLFDVFESEKLPQGVKSIGITLRFQSEERTLSSEEVNDLQKKILKDLETQFTARLR